MQKLNKNTGPAIVVNYDCFLGEQGTIYSQHKTHENAEKALHKLPHATQTFLTLKFIKNQQLCGA